jgi:hypothetical protein
MRTRAGLNSDLVNRGEPCKRSAWSGKGRAVLGGMTRWSVRISDDIGSAQSWKLLLVSRRHLLVDARGAHGAPVRCVRSHAMTFPFRCFRCRQVASSEPVAHSEQIKLASTKLASARNVGGIAFNALVFVRG